MTDWQPIETAPKDGTQILLARQRRPGWPQREFVVGHWNEKTQSWLAMGWVIENAAHWMPLPDPPA